MEIETKQPFVKDYINIMKVYTFGMLLREEKWDEEMMKVVRFYFWTDCDLHEVS